MLIQRQTKEQLASQGPHQCLQRQQMAGPTTHCLRSVRQRIRDSCQSRVATRAVWSVGTKTLYWRGRQNVDTNEGLNVLHSCPEGIQNTSLRVRGRDLCSRNKCVETMSQTLRVHKKEDHLTRQRVKSSESLSTDHDQGHTDPQVPPGSYQSGNPEEDPGKAGGILVLAVSLHYCRS